MEIGGRLLQIAKAYPVLGSLRKGQKKGSGKSEGTNKHH